MEGSHFIFDKFGFSKEWLRRPVEEWKSSPGYLELEDFLRNLLVTNDSAERGIKLVSDYAMSLTKDSEERQRILQVVELNRTEIPTNVTKKTLSQVYKTSQ